MRVCSRDIQKLYHNTRHRHGKATEEPDHFQRWCRARGCRHVVFGNCCLSSCLLNKKSAAIFRFGSATFVVVEPSCPVRCSSHLPHCIRLRIHLPRIQAICKLKFLFSCGANCDGVECHSCVDLTEFRFPIVVVPCFPSFPAGIDIMNMRSCSNFKCMNGDSFKSPHVASDCFENRCCHFRWASLRRCRASACCPACAGMLTFASGRQRGCQFLNAGYPSCPSLVRSVLHLFPVRCHVTFPNIHVASVTIECSHEKNARIGSLDQDDTCHGCSCKNPLFFSDCRRNTLTQTVRCASPSVSKPLHVSRLRTPHS